MSKCCKHLLCCLLLLLQLLLRAPRRRWLHLFLLRLPHICNNNMHTLTRLWHLGRACGFELCFNRLQPAGEIDLLLSLLLRLALLYPLLLVRPLHLSQSCVVLRKRLRRLTSSRPLPLLLVCLVSNCQILGVGQRARRRRPLRL